MSTFLNAGSTMIVLFITVVLGFMARKLDIVDDHFDSVMSKVIMTITCPAMILNSVLSNDSLPSDALIGQILGVSAITFIPIIVLAMFLPMLYRIPKGERGSHSFAITFGNTGFVGFAVCSAILGTQSVLYASIYNIVFNVLIFSVGAWLISRSGSIRLSRKEQLTYMRKNLVSPTMAACLIALALALLHITDDGIIGEACSLIGSMTPPASMLVIGSTLAKYKLGTMLKNVWAYITSLVRLLLVPAMVYFLGAQFITDPYLLASLTLVSSMPVAAMGPVICITYGGDLTTISQCMFLTTIMSIITIPLVTMCII